MLILNLIVYEFLLYWKFRDTSIYQQYALLLFLNFNDKRVSLTLKFLWHTRT